jgi:hypothetical protein
MKRLKLGSFFMPRKSGVGYKGRKRIKDINYIIGV